MTFDPTNSHKPNDNQVQVPEEGPAEEPRDPQGLRPESEAKQSEPEPQQDPEPGDNGPKQNDTEKEPAESHKSEKQRPYDKAQNWILTNLEKVLAYLFPEGKIEGDNFLVGNIEGHPGRSLVIALAPASRRGVFKDFALTNSRASRRICELWKKVREIPANNHARFFDELESFADCSFGFKGAAPDLATLWPEAVGKLSETDIQRLANHPKRRYRPETLKWFHAGGDLGLWGGRITFAMRNEAGQIVGVHRWFEEQNELRFLKSPTLLVIGDPSLARILHIQESTWDLIALLDRTNWHLDPSKLFFCTRGALNGKLVAGRIPSQIEKVYIWEQRDPPDANGSSPNQSWQRTVAKAAGCPVYLVPIPQGYKDLNEWCIGGGAVGAATANAISCACDLAALYQEPSARKTKSNLPPPELSYSDLPTEFPSPKERPCYRNYEQSLTIKGHQYEPGLYYHGTRQYQGESYPTDLRLGAPLYIIATVTNKRDRNYGLLLRFKSSKRTERFWAMPADLVSGDGAEVLAQLARDGYKSAHAHRLKLIDYLNDADPKIFKECATRTGWHNKNVFVLTDDVIVLTKAEEEGVGEVWFQAASKTAEYFCGGTLKCWQNGVALPAKGNIYLIYAISFALAGPLMEPLGLRGIASHIYGDSSTGKTSVLEVSASAWGHGKDYVQTWNTTSNALEGICAEHSDTLLALDEIQEVSGPDLDRIAYSAMNGQGKIRATRTGLTREPERWRVALLSTGEHSSGAKLAESGIRSKTGQEVRIPDIPGSGEQYGIFNDLHGAKDGDSFATALRDAASEHYGHAGREMIKIILATPADDLRTKYREILTCFQPSNSQQARVARTFAAVALAGELATSAGLVPWQAATQPPDYSDSDAVNASVALFNRWREAREDSSSFGSEHAKIMRAISQFLEVHGDARFSDLNFAPQTNPQNPAIKFEPRAIANRAGYWDGSNYDHRIFLLNSSALHEATKGFDFKRVLEALEQAEALVKKGTDSLAHPTYIPADGRTIRLYHIDPAKL